MTDFYELCPFFNEIHVILILSEKWNGAYATITCFSILGLLIIILPTSVWQADEGIEIRFNDVI